MQQLREMWDLSHTLAGAHLTQFDHPWEALPAFPAPVTCEQGNRWTSSRSSAQMGAGHETGPQAGGPCLHRGQPNSSWAVRPRTGWAPGPSPSPVPNWLLPQGLWRLRGVPRGQPALLPSPRRHLGPAGPEQRGTDPTSRGGTWTWTRDARDHLRSHPVRTTGTPQRSRTQG